MRLLNISIYLFLVNLDIFRFTGSKNAIVNIRFSLASASFYFTNIFLSIVRVLCVIVDTHVYVLKAGLCIFALDISFIWRRSFLLVESGIFFFFFHLKTTFEPPL